MIQWILFFAESVLLEYNCIFVIMARTKNIGGGDMNVSVTGGAGEFVKTLNILEEEYNFFCIEG